MTKNSKQLIYTNKLSFFTFILIIDTKKQIFKLHTKCMKIKEASFPIAHQMLYRLGEYHFDVEAI